MKIPARRLVAPVFAAIAVSLALTGCGGSDKGPSTQQKAPATVSGDQRGILETVDALQTASRSGDGQSICADIFTAHLVHSIETAAERSCVKEVKNSLTSPDAAISVGRDIKVTGASATATIREKNDNLSKLFLLKQDGRWRIDRVVAQKAS